MRRAILASSAAALLAGCGAATPGRPVSGAHVFAAECQVCHSLIGNESKHTQGGDLIHFHMSRATLTQFSREMPVKHRMSAAQLRAVVDYVRAAERRATSGLKLTVRG